MDEITVGWKPDGRRDRITVGWKPDGRRDRITVRGKTKTEVKDKLRAKHQELDANIRSEVDLEAGTVAVYRSVRLGGDTKTEKSRRAIQLPDIAVEALRDLVLNQAADRRRRARHASKTISCFAGAPVLR